jgi:hypothetical protein
MYKTYRVVFPTVTVHPVNEPGSEDATLLKNLIVVAGEGAAPGKSVLQERWRAVRARSRRVADLTKAIRDRHDRTIPTRDVPVLTDDYAPTDALLFIQ